MAAQGQADPKAGFRTGKPVASADFDENYQPIVHGQNIPLRIYIRMPWTVLFHDAFDSEFEALPLAVQDALAVMATLLRTHGPMLGRPHADTLAGSRHANMKELRFMAQDGVWRAAFAFDPARRAVILVAADKAGVAQKRFYKALIAKADKRFTAHLESLKEP